MTAGVENNQISSPRVNPRRFKVAIKGTPTFPVKRKVHEDLGKGVSWLVSKGVLSIVSKKNTKS